MLGSLRRSFRDRMFGSLRRSLVFHVPLRSAGYRRAPQSQATDFGNSVHVKRVKLATGFDSLQSKQHVFAFPQTSSASGWGRSQRTHPSHHVGRHDRII